MHCQNKGAVGFFFIIHYFYKLIVMNGVNSCLDAMAYVCCDPGDVMITPTPVYGRVLSNFEERCFVDVQPLHLRSGVRKITIFMLVLKYNYRYHYIV